VIAAALALLLSPGAPAAAGGGAAGGEGARAEPGRAEVRLGEPFDYQVALRHAPGERVELLPPGDLAPFALRGAGCRTRPGEGSALTVCTLKLQLLDLGEHRVPELQLRVSGPSGERVVPAPGAAVRGLGAGDAAGAEGPLRRPAAPPVVVPSWRLAARAAGAAAAALAAWLLWRLWRRRRLPPPAAALPPGERLARRVGEILALGLPGLGRGREHVLRLCDAAREYLAAVSPGAALDLTSAELLAELARRPPPGVDRGALADFLAAADLVKFARHDPGPEECRAASDFARALARAARPAPPAPGQEAA
jgi:hypothetical protein